MSTKPILVVMAAGMGSRYGGLKQIDPVGPSGEAILDYSLYDARRAGFKTVVFIIKHEIEQAFKEAVGARAVRAGFEVRYAYQQLEKLPEGFTVPEGRVKPWGTAHAILVAEEAIGDAPFAVINADDYYGPQGFKLIYDYLSTHADGDRYAWAMVGFLLGNTVSANGSVSRGVCVTDEHHNLVSVTERTCIEPYDGGIHYSEDGGASWTDLPADSVVSMNLWGFTPDYVQKAKAGFAAFLQEHGISECYLAGADAAACIKSTSFNMRKNGYTVHVLSDCITSYDRRKLPELLSYYESKGCSVLALSDVLRA